MNMKLCRQVLINSVAIVGVAQTSSAIAQTRNFNVPAQSASSGIANLARQANIQIFAASKDTSGKRTSAVQGDMSVEQALSKLLNGNGLSVRKTGNHTYSVVSSPKIAKEPARYTANAPSTESVSRAVVPAPTTNFDEENVEIVVTAQKREERLTDVPMSITAFTGDALRDARVTDATQLTQFVPGFSAQQNSYGSTVYSIRGIGFYDTSIGGAPAVSMYLDQVPLAYSAQARGVVLDLQGVEVLKGPQGTLFGQNSTGGAINYIAAKPTDQIAAGLDLDYGRFDRLNVEGFISGPIASNLNARIAARYEGGGAWQQVFAPVVEPFGFTGSSKLGARRFYNARAILEWTPSDRLSAVFTLNGWKDRSETLAPQFVEFRPKEARTPLNDFAYQGFEGLPTTPENARLAGWDGNTDYRRDDYFVQPALRIDYDISDSTRFTSISSYSYFSEKSNAEADGTGLSNFRMIRDAFIETFSQELRVAGEFESIRWMAGGNYEYATTSDFQTAFNRDGTSSSIGPFPYSFASLPNEQKVDTYSAFGSLDFAVSSELTLQGSLRYTKQDRSYEGCLADGGDGAVAAAFNFAFGAPAVPGGCVTMNTDFQLLPIVEKELNEENLSWRAGVDWKPNSDTMVYANIAKGFKAGSFSNLPALLDTQLTPVTQESVVAYEAGFKLAFADRRVNVNGAVFYYDYRDKQLLGFSFFPLFGIQPTLVNIPKSRITGAELEVAVRPIRGLNLSVNGTYLDTKILIDPQNPTGPFGDPTTFVGSPLADTPKLQVVAKAEYNFDISDKLEASLRTSASYRSTANGVLGDYPLFDLSSRTLIDLSAGIGTQDGMWRFELWGRNITNKYYLTGIWNLTDAITRTTGMPATYGMTLRFRM